MDYFLKQYKKICKEQFSGYVFKSYKNNHYRIINDVFQSFELHRSVYGDSCTVHFGVLPMCRTSPIDASTCPAMHLKMFENDFSWFPYDNKSEESINDCVNELKQYMIKYLMDFFKASDNCKNAYKELCSLEQKVFKTIRYNSWDNLCLALKINDYSAALQHLNAIRENITEDSIKKGRMENRLQLIERMEHDLKSGNTEPIDEFIHINEQRNLRLIADRKIHRSEYFKDIEYPPLTI